MDHPKGDDEPCIIEMENEILAPRGKMVFFTK